MAHAHCMLGNYGYKNALRICDTYWFYTATVVIREGASMLRYTYTVLLLDTIEECQFCYTGHCSKWPWPFRVHNSAYLTWDFVVFVIIYTIFPYAVSADNTTCRCKSSSLVCDFYRRPVILLLPPIINNKEAWDIAALRDSLVEPEIQIQKSSC